MKFNNSKKSIWYFSIISTISLSSFLFQNFVTSSSSKVKYDFNGDGRADILMISKHKKNPYRALYYSGNKRFVEQCMSAVDGECGLDTEYYMSHPLTKSLVGDFNGDGKSDILNISGDPEFTRRSLLLGTSKGLVTACYGQEDGACGLDTESYLTHPKTQIFVADFDGDGKDDLLVISGQTSFPRRVLHLSTGRGFRTACVGQSDGACGFDTESYMFNARTKLIVEDFNGDGKAEILVISGDPDFPRQKLMHFNGKTFTSSCIGQNGNCGVPDVSKIGSYDTRIYTGNFVSNLNKTKAHDLLILQKVDGKLVTQVLSFQKNKFVTACKNDPNETGKASNPSCGLKLTKQIFNPSERILLGDFNGDGLTDLVSIGLTNGITGPRMYYINKSKNNLVASFSEVCRSSEDGKCGFDTESYMNHPQTKFLVGDFSGTKKDQIFIISGSTHTRTLLLGASENKFQTVCLSDAEGCGISARDINYDYTITHNRYQSFPENRIAISPEIIYGSTLLSPGARGDTFTANMQSALYSGAQEIILDNIVTKTYVSGPLLLASNMTLTLGNGVTLQARSGAFGNKGDNLLRVNKGKNITIQGTKNSAIKMLKDEYKDGEWRTAISFFSSNNIKIKNLTVSSSGGDGIYLGNIFGAKSDGEFKSYCSNIHIDNVIVDNNTRNGLTVVSAVNLLVENSTFSRTRSHDTPDDLKALAGPWAGIDIEPNYPYEKIQNIVIRKNRFLDNKRWGIVLALKRFDTDEAIQNPVSISLIDNQISNSVYGIGFHTLPKSGGAIKVEGGQIEKSKYPIYYHDKVLPALAPKISTKNVKIVPLKK